MAKHLALIRFGVECSRKHCTCSATIPSSRLHELNFDVLIRVINQSRTVRKKTYISGFFSVSRLKIAPTGTIFWYCAKNCAKILTHFSWTVPWSWHILAHFVGTLRECAKNSLTANYYGPGLDIIYIKPTVVTFYDILLFFWHNILLHVPEDLDSVSVHKGLDSETSHSKSSAHVAILSDLWVLYFTRSSALRASYWDCSIRTISINNAPPPIK